MNVLRDRLTLLHQTVHIGGTTRRTFHSISILEKHEANLFVHSLVSIETYSKMIEHLTELDLWIRTGTVGRDFP